MRPAHKVGIAAVVVVLLGGGLFYGRQKANGLKNLFSLTYWQNRSTGVDLYSPQKHMLKSGRHDRPQILLTVDDGPHDTIIPMLDVLKEKHVPALFFVVGKNVVKEPALVKRMFDDGHEVGNHTFDHLRLTTLDKKKMLEQLDKCEQAVEDATGRKMTLLRPPGMDFNDAVIAEVQSKGYITVHWGVAAKDFVAKATDGHMTEAIEKTLSVRPEQVVERVMNNVRNGSIILLHDNPVTAKAMGTIVDRCRAAGYEFVSAKTMLANLPKPIEIESNPTLPNWKPKTKPNPEPKSPHDR